MKPRLERLRRTMDYLRGSHDGVASLEQTINLIMHELGAEVPGVVWGRIGAAIQESLESSGRLATAAEREYMRLAYGRSDNESDQETSDRSTPESYPTNLRRYGGIDGG